MRKPNFYIMYRMFKQGKVSGQIAVLITLVVAVVFLFVAVLMNLNKISQRKLQVTLATNTAAINMASMLASWSYIQWYESLGQQDTYCDKPSWIAKAIAYVVAVVLTIVGHPEGAYAVVAIILTVAGAVSLYLDITVVEPGIIEEFNKQMQQVSSEQSFTEIAIRTGLMLSINDEAKMLDGRDFDMDGMTDDYISVFSEFYRRRLISLQEDNTGFIDLIKLFICDIDGLADLTAYIKNYPPIDSSIKPCPTDPPYTGSFMNFMGRDDFIAHAGAPNSANANGIFYLFYKINEAGIDLDNLPYKVGFWQPGYVPCFPDDCNFGTYGPTETCTYTNDCSERPFSENDEVDSFLVDLNNFFLWAYGGWEFVRGASPSFIWQPGLLNTKIDILASSYNRWFSLLYKPASPQGTWYASTEQWANRINSWIDPSVGGSLANIKQRMEAEKTWLSGVYAQIQALNTKIAGFNAQIAGFNAQIAGFNAQIAALDAQISTASAWIMGLTIELNNLMTKMSEQTGLLNQLRSYSCFIEGPPRSCDGSMCCIKITSLLVQLIAADTAVENLQKSLAVMLGVAYVPGKNYMYPAALKITTLTGQVNAWKAERQSLIDQIPPLQAQIDDINNNQIAPLQAQVDAIYATLTGRGLDTEFKVALRITLLDGFINEIGVKIDKLLEFRQKIEGFQNEVRLLSGAKRPGAGPSFKADYSWIDKNDFQHHVRVQVIAPCVIPVVQGNAGGDENCYSLWPSGGSGMVAVRVTRYDENQKRPMLFAVGTELWRFIFHKPGVDVSHLNPADKENALKAGVSSTACAHYGVHIGELGLVECPLAIDELFEENSCMNW